ncbi:MULTISPECIES: hypothetical protein [unclassified Caulobacter]|uniref:hypothetical protein n=1 Tax=unclassified Caulobacter TaxID=2648921 RepID=UPI0006F9005A|nr:MULTISPECIES: hypothetical protein [unclassified Caulobacter]KQV55925.1 hypothetical protein ASC62_18585 [Caulobacter sp. Root342]KQV70901.1 hypothetical protein ASC70_04670 [Caulobacter sp. Root343]
MRHNRSMVPSMRSSHALALALALLTPAFAAAQEEVKVKSLAAPDYFSGPVADTGMGADLWKDTAPDIMRDVLPKLAGSKPLSPAFAALARRMLSTGANGPAGVGDNVEMGAQRGLALIALGEAKGANTILDRATGAPGSAALSMASAEAALIAGDDDKACRVQDALTVDRGAAYWLRLRAFCQMKAGQADAAQLTFQLVQQQTPKKEGGEVDYARLMGAALAGTAPGAASLKNGVNYALSRRLNLDIQSAAAVASASPALKPLIKPRGGDLSGVAPGADLTAAEASDLAFLRQAKTLPAFVEAAQASAASIAALASAGAPLQDPVLMARAALAAGDVASARTIRGHLVQDSIPGAGAADLAILDALIAAASGKVDNQVLGALVARGASGGSKSPAQAAAVLLASLGGTLDADARAQFATFDLGKPAASAARILLVEDAGAAKRKGEAGLLALSIAVDAGATGPTPVDRARIAHALNRAGLTADARAIVVEGLLSLAFVK